MISDQNRIRTRNDGRLFVASPAVEPADEPDGVDSHVFGWTLVPSTDPTPAELPDTLRIDKNLGTTTFDKRIGVVFSGAVFGEGDVFRAVFSNVAFAGLLPHINMSGATISETAPDEYLLGPADSGTAFYSFSLGETEAELDLVLTAAAAEALNTASEPSDVIGVGVQMNITQASDGSDRWSEATVDSLTYIPAE